MNLQRTWPWNENICSCSFKTCSNKGFGFIFKSDVVNVITSGKIINKLHLYGTKLQLQIHFGMILLPTELHFISTKQLSKCTSTSSDSMCHLFSAETTTVSFYNICWILKNKNIYQYFYKYLHFFLPNPKQNSLLSKSENP